MSVTRAKGRDDNSRLSGFVTRHGRHVIRRRDDTTRNRLRRVRSISYDHDRGHRARPARARFPETPRWAGGGRTPPRAPPSRRRSAEMETRATAWCVPPRGGSSEVFRRPHPSTRFWHTPRDRGCRRVRHTSGIATPRARTPTRVVITTQKRAGSEEVPCAWLGCCAPERAVNAKVLPLAGARESPPRVFE